MAKKTQNIKYKDINSLISAEYNPRQLKKEQYQNIKESLQRFGFVDPVIVNKNKDRKNIIIGGHQRVKVAKDLKYTEVPCIELDLTLDKEKELNIRLNKNVGEWDYDILANLFDFNDLMDWGFTEDDLAGFSPEEVEVEGLTDDDDIPEDVESVCKLGDIWKLGNHRLLCGDSTKKENVELLLDGNKADMVFTDPPYGVNYEGGHFHSGDVKIKRKRDKLLNDDNAEIYDKFLSAIIPFVDGAIYTWFADSKGYDVYNAIINNNCEIHALIIWHKTNATYSAMNAQYKQRHEPCLYFKPKGKTLKWCGKSTENTIWELKTDGRNKLHPTQKPVELAVKAISNHKANNVLDVFLGSGSTLIACEKTNRVCYGMELDEHYCDVIINRWEQFTGKKAELING
ncbi:MAG: putative modification methylase [Prokaryotic dsDNA virus sp.]|nr:MAG: putative modification methylase [Prokaryotic dsDNA virus sp.]|tara:strand:- start:10808 stop:12004 length:1197 start_codon:yes stop_codon:yes gene_type:complete